MDQKCKKCLNKKTKRRILTFVVAVALGIGCRYLPPDWVWVCKLLAIFNGTV